MNEHPGGITISLIQSKSREYICLMYLLLRMNKAMEDTPFLVKSGLKNVLYF